MVKTSLCVVCGAAAWAVCALSAVSTVTQAMPMVLKEHPLVNKIWSAQDQSFVDKQTLFDKVAAHQVMMLGETHDNPLHHQYQAEVISSITARGRKPSVVFEMLNMQQIKAIEGRDLTSADQFFELTKWDDTGWPSQELYREVMDAVVSAKLSIHAGSFDRDTIGKIVTKGEEFVPQEVKTDLQDLDLSETQHKELAKEIEHTHCNMLPENMYKGMMLGQRTKDVLMAIQLKKYMNKDGVVLVAGSGHARNDRGVPAYLKRKNPGIKVFSIAWVEVDEEGQKPDDYAKGWGTNTLPFDAVWFTAKVDRPDPCEELKKYAKHHKKPAAEE